MPIITDYSLAISERGVLTIEMTPPTPIGGWSLDFYLMKRFGSQAYLIQNSVASGFNGASGITITNSGAGIMNIVNQAIFMSGQQPGYYAWVLQRTNSGHQTEVAKGWRLADW